MTETSLIADVPEPVPAARAARAASRGAADPRAAGGARTEGRKLDLDYPADLVGRRLADAR